MPRLPERITREIDNVSERQWNKIWQPYVDTAIGAWQKGDRARSEKIVSLLVQVMQQSQKYDRLDANLIQGLYTLADHFCREHEYWRAEWIYLHILETQEDVVGEDDEQTLETLQRLNRIVKSSDKPVGVCFEFDDTTRDLPIRLT